MIQVTPQMRIVAAIEPVDFRCGIDGLARLCKEALKILVYDGQGFWLCHKRLSSGKFCWWPAGKSTITKTLAAHQMQVLLSAGNPETTQAAPAWRSVGPAD